MICIVSHDAGGAEILSSFVRQTTPRCLFSLEGPALNIFRRKLSICETLSLETALEQAEWLLCGTSWQSDLEWRAIAIARKQGKRSVAFLDHWVNYRERFIRNGIEHLPDELWVGDAEAEAIAIRLFPRVTVRYVENPYFSDLRKELPQLRRAEKSNAQSLNVLYVCQILR